MLRRLMFAGLWLKRVLVIGALGSALACGGAGDGPARCGPLPPESLVEFVLWLWLCVTLGLTVNSGAAAAGAGDPLTLRKRGARHAASLVRTPFATRPASRDLAPLRRRCPSTRSPQPACLRLLALLKTARSRMPGRSNGTRRSRPHHARRSTRDRCAVRCSSSCHGTERSVE